MVENLLKFLCGAVICLTFSVEANAISPDDSFVQTPGDATASNLFLTFPPLGTTASMIVESIKSSQGNYKAEIELAKPAAQTFLEKGTLTPQLSRAFELVRDHNKKFCQDLGQADTKYLARQIVTQKFPKPNAPAAADAAPTPAGH